MRKVAAVMAVVVLALTLCQPVSAAPTQGMTMAAQHSNSLNLFERFLGLFSAIWGGKDAAIWGGKP